MVAEQRTEKYDEYNAWIHANKKAREKKAYGIIHIPQCFKY